MTHFPMDYHGLVTVLIQQSDTLMIFLLPSLCKLCKGQLTTTNGIRGRVE